jgi:GAF domain-containing protein
MLMTTDFQSEPMVLVGAQFAELSAALMSDDGAALDPERVARFAARAIPHTGHCGLTLLRAGHPPRTMTSTDPLPRRVDELQYAMREGPCLDAAQIDSVCVTGSLETDERWPAFGPRCASEIGVHSMLAVRLPLAGDDYAAINFYSSAPDAFTEQDIGVASIFAPFAALAVEHALRKQDTANFNTALSSSRQIGTAIGIIMARTLVTSDEAFEILRSASQGLNRKLRDIAAEVEETGELPTARPKRDAVSKTQ